MQCPRHGPNATWEGGGQRPLGNGTGTGVRVTAGGACPLRRHKIGVLSRPSGLQQEEGRRGHSEDTRSKGKARSSRRRPARAAAKAGGPRTSKCGPRPGLGRRGGGETRGIFGELVPPPGPRRTDGDGVGAVGATVVAADLRATRWAAKTDAQGCRILDPSTNPSSILSSLICVPLLILLYWSGPLSKYFPF